jgi:hypothetical protein
MTRRSVLAALAAVAGGTAAHADTVKLTYQDNGAGRNVRVTLNSDTFNCFSGQLIHQFSNGTGVAAGLTGNKVTFCTDLNQSVTSSGATYNVVPISTMPEPGSGMGNTRAQAVYNLYAGAAGSQSDGGASNTLASAFQIALWEIVYDYNGTAGSLNLTSGNVKFKETDGSALLASTVTQVNALLSAISTNVPQTGLLGLANDFKQDQILPITVIPIPAALPLGLAGLGLAAAVRRRMSKA